MKEEEIRPKIIMHENEKLRAEDIRQLLTYKDKFEEIPCPACESNDNNFTFVKKGFTFVTCAKCETVFINPRPTLEMLAEYYTTSKSIKHWNDKIFPASENSRRDQIFIPRAKRIVELCKKYGVATEVIVDIGAGFGTFAEEVQKLNIFKKVIAVEPSPDLAATCRKKGLAVIESTIEKAKINEASIN